MDDDPTKATLLDPSIPLSPSLPSSPEPFPPDKELSCLVKFANLSYRHCEWVPGDWLRSVQPVRLGAYERQYKSSLRHGTLLKPLTQDEAIPDRWTRPEKILDVEFIRGLSGQKVRPALAGELRRVKGVLVKWQGLEYEDITWEDAFDIADPAYSDYLSAYRAWRLAEVAAVESRNLRVPRELGDIRKDLPPFRKLLKQPKSVGTEGRTLLGYQLEGLNWLAWRWWQGKPALLADEMGLGKTVQVAAFLSLIAQRVGASPALLVVPMALIRNWQRELAIWAPRLSVVAYWGSAESRRLQREYEMFGTASDTEGLTRPKPGSLRCHVVLTTYEYMQREGRIFKQVRPWQCVVVDEGQRLKGEGNALWRSMQGLQMEHRVLLTGTPFQNNIQELFQLLHFLDPDQFGDLRAFQEHFSDLDQEKLGELHELLKPLLLRRTKKEVLKNLPPKVEMIVPVSMTPLQRQLYKATFSRNVNVLRAITGSSSSSTANSEDSPTPEAASTVKARTASLHNILMELRKILNHPYLGASAVEEAEVLRAMIESCGKLQFLHIFLQRCKQWGRRVLIFSQMTRLLDILEDYLRAKDIGYQRLDGATGSTERQVRVDAFNAPDSPDLVFLLSTRAGGVGLNLASADTVILYDMDFNPHQDIQALSRAHRYGQDRPVFVYRLVTMGSAEERIMQVAKRKLLLDHLIITRMADENLEPDDVEGIIKHGAKQLFMGGGGGGSNGDGATGSNDRSVVYDGEKVDAMLERSKAE
ncbi:MAG: P-loop containing nucleoside triphosphate hydrolase protein, partial [Piptocephalis tieghemiana]